MNARQLGSHLDYPLGEENSDEALTSKPRQVKRRGPISELTDPQLHNRRDQLVQTFENAWGQIGWELRTCKKADALIRILTPLAEGYIRDIIAPFCYPSNERGSPAVLRKLRAKRRAVVKLRYEAGKPYRESLEKLQRADWALAQATKGKRRLVKQERKQRRKVFSQCAQTYLGLCEKERELEGALRNNEASFARQQLFRFLRSHRYELTPVSLANAAAGQPYMSWRRSMERNKGANCQVADGLLYQVFKAIRYLTLTLTAKDKVAHRLVIRFREGIPLLPSRYRLPRAELAEKWWYLERAIRQAVRNKPHPRALHFEIMKQYLRQMGSTLSQVDIVLAEHGKLPLLK